VIYVARFTGMFALVVLSAVACESGIARQTSSRAISPIAASPVPKAQAALTPPAPASMSPCRADQMSAQYRGIEGALGHTGVILGFANTSSTQCVLEGIPLVRLVTAEGQALSLRQESGVYFTDNDGDGVALHPGLPLAADPAEDLGLGQALLVFEWMACPPQPRIARILLKLPEGGTISIPRDNGVMSSGAPMCAPDRTVEPWLAVGTFESVDLLD
jgi:uncharacterized protein DUF4232